MNKCWIFGPGSSSLSSIFSGEHIIFPLLAIKKQRLAAPDVYVVDREEALRAETLVCCLESDLTGWLISSKSLIRQRETTQMRSISGHSLIFIEIKADKRKWTRGRRMTHACVWGCASSHTYNTILVQYITVITSIQLPPGENTLFVNSIQQPEIWSVY